VGELQERLKRQRSLLSRIDRKVSSLNERLERVEKAVRELEAEHGQARTDLQRAVAVAFAGQRAGAGNPWYPFARERERHFMRLYLAANAEAVARITRARERKEEELSGLERQVAVTERKRTMEKKVGRYASLPAGGGAAAPRRHRAGEEAQGEGAEIPSREDRPHGVRRFPGRAAGEGAGTSRAEEVGRGSGAREPAEAPRRFASLSGGLSAPLAGKVVTRFGRQHDATFDVTIENRGVEIEAPSGASVKAVGQGEVAFAGSVSGFGNVLIVQHGGGLFFRVRPPGTFLVKQGES